MYDPASARVVSTVLGVDAVGHNGSMSNEQPAAAAAEVRIDEVQQRTLRAIQAAVDAGDHERAHCLAETYESLVRATTMDHQAMKVAAERALRQLEAARARAQSGPNAAVPKSALETA